MITQKNVKLQYITAWIKKQQQTSFKYKLCGIDKAMEKANAHINKLQEEHKHIFSNQVIRKC